MEPYGSVCFLKNLQRSEPPLFFRNPEVGNEKASLSYGRSILDGLSISWRSVRILEGAQTRGELTDRVTDCAPREPRQEVLSADVVPGTSARSV